MGMRSEQLCEMFTLSRDLSNHYYGEIKDKDPHQIFTANGLELNNVYWIIGHMSCYENLLVLNQIGIMDYKTDWMKLFAYGSKVPKKNEGPKFDEVYDHFLKIHEVTKAKLPLFDDEKLDKKSQTGFKIADLDTCAHTIMHGIRHEGCHSGHLSWLVKLYLNVS